MSAAKADEIRTKITNQIIESLKNGHRPWVRPWSDDPNCGSARNIASKKKYRGINPMILEIASLSFGFQNQWWGTFNQWKALGVNVKKRPADVKPGQWGTSIVFYKIFSKIATDKKGATILDKDGNPKKNKIFLLRDYTVFNLEQVDAKAGKLDKFLKAKQESAPQEPDWKPAQELLEATKADIRYGGDKAYYNPDQDYIKCPKRNQFTSLRYFYDTMFHELAHWTEHKSRLNWNRPDEGYAMGELIAEISACYTSAELHVPANEDLTNHENYIANWLEKMKGDPKFIFKAATQASKATNYLLNFVGLGENVEGNSDEVEEADSEDAEVDCAA